MKPTTLEKLFSSKSQDEQQPLLRNDHSDFLLDEKNDKYRIVYWIYIVCGITSLLPWNVFITASGYFTKRFLGTAFEETFQNYFSTYFTSTNLIAYALVMWLQNKSSRFRIDPMVPIVINTLVFGVMAMTVKLNFYNDDGVVYFYLVMSFLILTAISTSLFQNAIFSEASQLPPIYLQAVLGGQGFAGIIVSFTSVASILVPTTSSEQSAFVYFLVACLLSTIAMIGRFCISHNSFYKSYMKQTTTTAEADSTTINRVITTRSAISSVWRKTSRFAFSVCYLFIITLMVFPSITSFVRPVNPSIDSQLFVAIHFLVFNLGDWMGRTLPVFPMFVTTKINRLLGWSVLRTCFIPVFLTCNIVVMTSDRWMPTLINNDFIYLGLCWLFALTNGWCCSLTMMAAPQNPNIREHEKSMVGSIMSFSLVLGLAIGGNLSFVTRAMI